MKGPSRGGGGGGGGVSNDWCINPLFKFVQKSVFQSKRKRKTKSNIQICFSMSCKNEKCKWNLNSIFPCYRKTVGTKVHAFDSFTYLKLHQEAKETKYEIRSISEYYVTITRPAVLKGNTSRAVSNTNKGKKVKFIVQISFAEKN